MGSYIPYIARDAFAGALADLKPAINEAGQTVYSSVAPESGNFCSACLPGGNNKPSQNAAVYGTPYAYQAHLNTGPRQDLAQFSQAAPLATSAMSPQYLPYYPPVAPTGYTGYGQIPVGPVPYPPYSVSARR